MHIHRHRRLGPGARIPAAVVAGIVAMIIMRRSGKRGMAIISTVRYMCMYVCCIYVVCVYDLCFFWGNSSLIVAGIVAMVTEESGRQVRQYVMHMLLFV